MAAEISNDNNELQPQDNDFGEVLFQWTIPEYIAHERSLIWYLIMIGLALILIIYSIFTANFLFALIIIVAIFIVFLKSYSQPKELTFQITDQGLILGTQFFPYSRINKFYIIYKPPTVKKIFFDLKGLSPDLSVWLDEMNPLEVRETLLEFLQEDLEKERQTIDDILDTLLKL
ncbi:MAG: hypothetical protein WC460_03915 [Patescibacteria group bacterium]